MLYYNVRRIINFFYRKSIHIFININFVIIILLSLLLLLLLLFSRHETPHYLLYYGQMLMYPAGLDVKYLVCVVITIFTLCMLKALENTSPVLVYISYRMFS